MQFKEASQLDRLYRVAQLLRCHPLIKCPLCRQSYSGFRAPEVAHFRKRRYLNTRWYIPNSFMACSICNAEDNDEKHRAEIKRRGIDPDYLIQKSLSNKKVYFDEVRDYLVSYINRTITRENFYIIDPKMFKTLGITLINPDGPKDFYNVNIPK